MKPPDPHAPRHNLDCATHSQVLVDYTPEANWGNWQYLAGVGADPRGHRRFDLSKQTEIYDPDNRFIERWGGDDCSTVLDSNDAADWPITEASGN